MLVRSVQFPCMLFRFVECWYVLVVVLVGWLSQYRAVSMSRAVQLRMGPGASARSWSLASVQRL